MPKKAPVNKSLSWEVLAAGSPLVIFAAVANQFFPGMFQNHLPDLMRLAAMGCFATTGLMAAHNMVSANPIRQLKVAFEYCGLYTEKQSGIKLPKLKTRDKWDNGLYLTYELPPGLCKTDFESNRERLEQALNGELSFKIKNGLLHVGLLFGEIPEKEDFTLPEFPPTYDLPVTIGYSRAGLEIADLAEFPHLLVAGQTFGGKSVFLHQLIACLLPNENCKLFVVDMAKAEFAYIKNHAWFAYTVPRAHEMLSYLVQELDHRLELLEKAGVEKVQNYPGEMPYLVLVIDEFSNLSPQLSKHDSDKEKKSIREECHSMLVDLLCRARKVGIHIVISSQRPDRDVLPGQMKGNIPASVVFQVRNRVNSQICLDNDRAADLPGVRGRAIYQFADIEREVQVMHLPPARARERLPKKPFTQNASPAPILSGHF